MNLPRLTSVTLTSFSLYSLRRNVTSTLTDGVFCVAGANGLGKSSFIAALNFGLTGGVAPPRPRFDQLSQYARDARNYSDTYFTGRISEFDRESASVLLTFVIGNRTYSIERRFFRAHELASLVITDSEGKVLVDQAPTMDAEERQALYEEHVVADTGLQSFAQFLFLQHYVFTFDEWRHLLFWDNRASELVLYLALGLDPGLARRADELRKQANVAGSNARNAQYQSTIARNELRRIADQLEAVDGVPSALRDDYSVLQSRLEELNQRRSEVLIGLTDARLEFAAASAGQMAARHAYEEAFRRRVAARKGPRLDPLVMHSLEDHKCRVCGTQHDHGPDRIATAIADGRCPLCDAGLVQTAGTDAAASADELTTLDAALSDAVTSTASSSKSVERLEGEHRELQRDIAVIQAALTEMEDRYKLSASAIKGTQHDDLVAQMQSFQTAIDLQLARKEEQVQARSDALAEFEPIQEALQQAWREAESSFVPRFRNLAESFIGLPIQVSLDTGTSVTGTAHLALSVNDTHRRKSEQLSESQRFFLDIALRMSLAQHMSGATSNVCLYVDTPEGALDIAYEARAGDMFSNFVSEGDQLVMTANVNTSQLLRRMAARCGRSKMQLVRMTEWTTLSDVQVEEEALFTAAFEAIEAALDSAPGGS